MSPPLNCTSVCNICYVCSARLKPTHSTGIFSSVDLVLVLQVLHSACSNKAYSKLMHVSVCPCMDTSYWCRPDTLGFPRLVLTIHVVPWTMPGLSFSVTIFLTDQQCGGAMSAHKSLFAHTFFFGSAINFYRFQLKLHKDIFLWALIFTVCLVCMRQISLCKGNSYLSIGTF